MDYASSDTLKARLVEVPYNPRSTSPTQVSMLFILPDESLSLEFGKWLKSESLTWPNIAAAMKEMKRVSVDLTLPKFKVESNLSLKRVLMDLGMTAPFTAKANFTEMVGRQTNNLALDGVIHSAKVSEFSFHSIREVLEKFQASPYWKPLFHEETWKIPAVVSFFFVVFQMEVDEYGTEAAAATIIKVMYMSMPIPLVTKVDMTLSRSFLAMIILRDGPTVVPLFTSVVNKL